MNKIIDEIKITQELIKKPSVTPKDVGAMNVVASNLKKLGFKCKMSNIQAAIGCAQMKRIDELVDKKIEILNYLITLFVRQLLQLLHLLLELLLCLP